jgi:hypothetical protein
MQHFDSSFHMCGGAAAEAPNTYQASGVKRADGYASRGRGGLRVATGETSEQVSVG